MDKKNVKIVGSSNEPIKVYWDVKDKKTDEFLLLLSICSGAYGKEFVDTDTFYEVVKKFFRYSKHDVEYENQLKFVLHNCDEELSTYLDSVIYEKWKISLRDDICIDA